MPPAGGHPRGAASTLNDVAREAGVSATTVSHVINGTRYVSAATAERVRHAIERLHYEVNSAARSLVSERSHTLGLMIADITNPFHTSIARAVEDTAGAAGYNIILCNTDEDAAKELSYLRVLRQKRVDGILLAPTGEQHASLLDLARRGFPLVVLGRQLPWLDCDAVVTDPRDGARQAVNHLVGLGHRRIGFICERETPTRSARLQGYLDALAAHAISEDWSLIVETNLHLDGGYRGMLRLLDLPARPRAIIAASNVTTVGALAGLQSRGVGVPEDVALIGFSNHEWAVLARPQLTAIVRPAYEIGKTATEMLLARIQDRAPSAFREVVLPTQLVVRESCGSGRRVGMAELERLFGGGPAPRTDPMTALAP